MNDEIGAKNILEKFKLNLWMITTVILACILIVSMMGPSITGMLFSNPKAIGEKIVSNINANAPEANAKLINITEKSGLYLVKLEIQGDVYDLYASKDGSLLFPQAIDLNAKKENQVQQTIPKSDKPKVELFVMSHCPYGTQTQKGIIPVVKLLKDKIDFNIRFVYYAMHGETEVKEQLTQYCIQKEQNDKYLDYLSCFLEAGNTTACLTKIKIDTTKLDSCTQQTDKEFQITENLNDQSKWLNGRYPAFNIDKDLNEEYGIGGSPTLVINEQTVDSKRDPQSLLNTICSAFNSKPAECSQELSSETPSPGFGYSTGSSSSGSCG